MADETIITPPPAEATPAEPTEQERERDAALKWINAAAPDELLKVNRLGGILGQREQQAREQERQRMTQESARTAREDAEKELDRLAREDPDAFSQRYLSDKEQQRIREQQETLRLNVRTEFAAKIGQTFRGLAEWQELTPVELGKLQEAVAGKSDDDALGAFNVAALEIVSERRASKRLAEWKTKDLAKEREAVRAEEAAKLFAKSERPDLTRGSQAAAFDPTKLPAAEFDKWYAKEMLGRT